MVFSLCLTQRRWSQCCSDPLRALDVVQTAEDNKLMSSQSEIGSDPLLPPLHAVTSVTQQSHRRSCSDPAALHRSIAAMSGSEQSNRSSGILAEFRGFECPEMLINLYLLQKNEAHLAPAKSALLSSSDALN